MLRFLLILALLWGVVATRVQAQTAGCPAAGQFTYANCVTLQGFVPQSKVTLAPSSVSSNVALPTFGTSLSVLVHNTGSVDAYWALGTTNAVTATTSSPIIPAGGWAWLPQGNYAYLAAITATGSTSLDIFSGAGVPTIMFGNETVTLTPGSSVTTTPATTTPTTQASGTVTTGGTFQQVLAANPARTACTLQNNSTHTGYVYWLGSGTATEANSLQLAPGNVFTCANPSGGVLKTAIQYTTTTTADPFSYSENQ